MDTTVEFLLSLKSGDNICVDTKLLSLIKNMINELEYRNPACVIEYIRYPQNIKSFCDIFEICPKCGLPINRTYQEYCSGCGQRLSWIDSCEMRENRQVSNQYNR